MRIWGVVKVVLLGAAVACCFLSVGADVSIDTSFEIGTLSDVVERFALFELGNGVNQKSWRQLGDETWHKSAFRSFFAVGSLDANQMNALAAQNNKTDTWASSNVTVKVTSDLIHRLQVISTTHYQMSRSITGTGNITASLWILMFSCGSTSCSDGYMVPILAAKQGPTSYSYVTAWLPVTDGMLMNAIPASISKKAIFNPTQEDHRPASVVAANIQEDLPPCPKARVHSFRTLLDSAYGLAPAITCLGFSDDDSFKIVVTSASMGNGSTSAGSTVKQTLKSLALMFLNVSEWLPQPFEKCSERPLIILSEEGIGSDSSTLPHMCHHNKCMIFFPTSQNKTGLQFLKGLEKVLDEGPSQCTSIGNNITTCDSLYNVSSFYDLSSTNFEPFPSSLRSSDWASTEGNQTSEFYYAPHGENLTVCAIKLTPPLYQLKPPMEIEIQAIDYLTAYITQHNTAFTTDKGSATDPYTFYALLITTALSVITIAVPFTNFMLRVICRMHPVFFNIQNGKVGGASMASKVFIQVCCNVALTLAFFLPVLSLAKNEMDRQDEFSNWALASDDLVSEDLTPAPIRVVYLFALTSQYNSNFLTVIVLVMCLTCLFVAVCTAWRCLQVFARYRLLFTADTLANLTKSSAIMQALKAIEMGDAEYLELKQLLST